jgi:hypothetical protein
LTISTQFGNQCVHALGLLTGRLGRVQEQTMPAVALIDEEQGRFGVTFPDFPGCTTMTKSLAKAVSAEEISGNFSNTGSCIFGCTAESVPV